MDASWYGYLLYVFETSMKTPELLDSHSLLDSIIQKQTTNLLFKLLKNPSLHNILFFKIELTVPLPNR